MQAEHWDKLAGHTIAQRIQHVLSLQTWTAFLPRTSMASLSSPDNIVGNPLCHYPSKQMGTIATGAILRHPHTRAFWGRWFHFKLTIGPHHSFLSHHSQSQCAVTCNAVRRDRPDRVTTSCSPKVAHFSATSLISMTHSSLEAARKCQNIIPAHQTSCFCIITSSFELNPVRSTFGNVKLHSRGQLRLSW